MKRTAEYADAVRRLKSLAGTLIAGQFLADLDTCGYAREDLSHSPEGLGQELLTLAEVAAEGFPEDDAVDLMTDTDPGSDPPAERPSDPPRDTEGPEIEIDPYACPACSHVGGNESRQDSNGVTTCGGCNALFGTRAIYAGESHTYVLPRFSADPAAANVRYFDFTVLRGDGTVGRRHGWFNPTTKMITQTG